MLSSVIITTSLRLLLSHYSGEVLDSLLENGALGSAVTKERRAQGGARKRASPLLYQGAKSPVSAGVMGRRVPCLVWVREVTEGCLGASQQLAGSSSQRGAKGPKSRSWWALLHPYFLTWLRLPLGKIEALLSSTLTWGLSPATLHSS